MSNEPVIVEQQFKNVSVAVVWKAITDQDQMREWYFQEMADFQANIGFETQFNVHCEGKDYMHIWKVTEVAQLQRIAYRWRYDGYAGDSIVTWELSEVDGGTKLKLTHAVLEPFVGDPIFDRENGVAGWEYLIQESLKTFLQA